MTKINCNLCTMFFNSTDDFLDVRMKKHEEWHKECTYFGSKNVMVKRTVVWRHEK